MLLFYVFLCVFHCVVLFVSGATARQFQLKRLHELGSNSSKYLSGAKYAIGAESGLFIDLRTFLVDFANILDKCLVFLLMIFEKCSKPFYVLFLPFLLYCCARLPEHRFSS